MATGGFIYKKSGSWTEYFRLWGGAVTWKRKYIIVTNVGLLIFDESQTHQLRKPKKFICAQDFSGISYLRPNQYQQLGGMSTGFALNCIFKITDVNDSEVILAAASEKDARKWLELLCDIRQDHSRKSKPPTSEQI